LWRNFPDAMQQSAESMKKASPVFAVVPPLL
jgi:hypothetical protein